MTTIERVTNAAAIDYTDQRTLFDPNNFAEGLTLIGVGGIGTAMLNALVNVGFRNFVLYDDDFVEPRNLASQVLYSADDLTRPKVEVCQEYLERFGATSVTVHQRKFTAEDELTTSVVIGAVDSMKVRQDIWQAVKASADVQIYLDGRIGALNSALFAVDPLDGDWYERLWLFDDENAVRLECGARAIVHPSMFLAAMATAHLINWHASGGTMPPRRIEQNMKDYFFQIVDPRYRNNALVNN